MTVVAIIGAGVNGLSTGIELLKKGYEVIIFTDQITPNTTSDIACAIWMPYKVAPKEQAMSWAASSLEQFKQFAKETDEAGILFKTHTELHSKYEQKPEWMNFLEQLPVPSYVPAEYKANSFTVKIPVIDTKKYMPYLHKLFLTNGGKIHTAKITALTELYSKYNVVINCAGLGAKELVNDNTVYPIRGHVLSIKKPEGFDDSMVCPDDALAHIISRTDDCLIGGTAEENNWSTTPDSNTKEQILSRVKTIYPPLANQPIIILKEMIGLRPGRPTVRLEMSFHDLQHVVIHNYGHGGAGFALSWGCAQAVATLTHDFINSLLANAQPSRQTRYR
ncbi:MAG: FAD-dependent oxidoreductase [Pseudomonadota bacterium]